MAKKATPKSKVVAATGVAVASRDGADAAARIEQAMSRAVQQAYADGLADKPDEIRARMLAARDEALKANG